MPKKDKQKAVPIQMERQQFTSLLQQNPNYFGTLAESSFPIVSQISGDTRYEELVCLGYNPPLNTLEATIEIKKASGYGGNLCQAGSSEFVRFFINYGSGWEDLGVAGFEVHNIPDGEDCRDASVKPLTYIASLPFQPKSNFCGVPVIPTVRAILSWQVTPPAGNPGYIPTWGNTLSCPVQIKPRRWVIDDIFTNVLGNDIAKVVKIPQYLLNIKDQEIPQPQPEPLSFEGLFELYQPTKSKKAIEAHRFGFSDIQSTLATAKADPSFLQAKMAQWQKYDLNILDAFKAIEVTKGNTSYEELYCLGLDSNRDWLGATFRVKKQSGYSGSLCEAGSQEHVAFWADWNDSCQWTYLGTSSIKVHDIEAVGEEGLHFTAVLPVDLSTFRPPCTTPKIGRIRAVLSWNALPSTTNPDVLPTWGNRLDAHVLISPAGIDDLSAKISILGGVGINDIQTATTGLTTPTAMMAPWGSKVDPLDRQCPFGGLITAHAVPKVGLKYRVKVRPVGSTDEEILKDKIWVVDKDGVGSFHTPNAFGFFDYLHVTQNVLNLLATWKSNDENGLFELQLEQSDGSVSPWYRLRIDNTKPSAKISISDGACDTYTPGTSVSGTFVARDSFFGHYILDTLPASMTPPAPVASPPLASTSPTGIFGHDWTLSTVNMVPCGYVVRVRVWDRTIVGSKPGSHNHNVDDKGFCLLADE